MTFGKFSFYVLRGGFFVLVCMGAAMMIASPSYFVFFLAGMMARHMKDIDKFFCMCCEELPVPNGEKSAD